MKKTLPRSMRIKPASALILFALTAAGTAESGKPVDKAKGVK